MKVISDGRDKSERRTKIMNSDHQSLHCSHFLRWTWLFHDCLFFSMVKKLGLHISVRFNSPLFPCQRAAAATMAGMNQKQGSKPAWRCSAFIRQKSKNSLTALTRVKIQSANHLTHAKTSNTFCVDWSLSSEWIRFRLRKRRRERQDYLPCFLFAPIESDISIFKPHWE